MNQVHTANVKVSTQDGILAASPDSSCRLIHLRTKGEVEADNGTGAVTRSPESILQNIL